MCTLKVYLPWTMFKSTNLQLKGRVTYTKTGYYIFFTEVPLDTAPVKAKNEIEGFIATSTNKNVKKLCNYIEIGLTTNYFVRKFVMDRKNLVTSSLIFIFYDHDNLLSTEALPNIHRNEELHELYRLLRKENGCTKFDDKIFLHNGFQWLCSSMFFKHTLKYFYFLTFVLHSFLLTRKMPLRHGNLLSAIVLDVAIGYLILNLISIQDETLANVLMDNLAVVVSNLRAVLKWIMGAPAGLKLNFAFNNMLGRFFTYHVDLWWMFIELVKDGLGIVLNMYEYIGYLGFTFQAAMLADMIFFVTFHTYCIYVYIARLFYYQVSLIISLLRLFVGRKYNPLLQKVDTCEYTSQQLFVGTVAFTILLFLMPTTATYYLVFTLFRFLSLTIQGTLAKTINFILNMPIYSFILWAVGSSKISGKVYMEVVQELAEGSVVVRLKLKRCSLGYLIEEFRPIAPAQTQSWTELVSSVVRGELIKPL